MRIWLEPIVRLVILILLVLALVTSELTFSFSISQLYFSAMIFPETSPQVEIVEFSIPSHLRVGETFAAEIAVESSIETEGILSLWKGAELLHEKPISIKVGKNHFSFDVEATNRGKIDLVSEILVQNGKNQDDFETKMAMLPSRAATSIVLDRPKILVVDESPESIFDFVTSLREQGIVVEVRHPNDFPKLFSYLIEYAAIIFSDAPAFSISEESMEMIRKYVSEYGGGFMMIGSFNSFGPGGYLRTPIETILPVRCDFEMERETPSVALSLLIDRSGSMGGEKIEWAKEAAKSAVALLTPQDFVSIIVFDAESHILVPMQPVTDQKAIIDLISRIESDGGTNFYPALVECHEQLRLVSARIKHAMLLSDGYTNPGQSPKQLERKIEAMGEDRITFSTIGIGEADYPLLQQLSETGKGRFYRCDDTKKIPQIFVKETMRASRKSIREEPFQVVPTQKNDRKSNVLHGINIDKSPLLLGFVASGKKPTSDVILVTETGEPILVLWRFGLGVVAAFLSDAKNDWGAEWIQWSEYRRFWTQLVREIMRSPVPQNAAMKIEEIGDSFIVSVDLIDENGQFVNDAIGELSVTKIDYLAATKTKSAEMTQLKMAFDQTGPGRYEIEIEKMNVKRIDIRFVDKNKKPLAEFVQSVHPKHENWIDKKRIVSVSFFCLVAAAVMYLFDIYLRRFHLPLNRTNMKRNV
ncbi:MAG: VWA domain-containing protein [Thermoguttaceae bacterium]